MFFTICYLNQVKRLFRFFNIVKMCFLQIFITDCFQLKKLQILHYGSFALINPIWGFKWIRLIQLEVVM